MGMLTTFDNPFDPHIEFDEWYQYDTQMGYNTCAYLARIASTSHALSEADQEAEIDRAIKEILKYNITGMYTLIEPKKAS